jgi:hypothetical protein
MMNSRVAHPCNPYAAGYSISSRQGAKLHFPSIQRGNSLQKALPPAQENDYRILEMIIEH